MIGYKIDNQNYERILIRIGSILVSEYINQAAQHYNTDCEGIKFYVERSAPIDHTELSFINISTFTGQFGNKHTASVDGSYVYNIDTFTNSKYIGDEPGDKLASLKMQRLMGINRAIISDPIYKTLSFAPGFIARVEVTGFEVLEIRHDQGTLMTKVGRLQVTVRANENIPLPDAPPLESAITQVKLGISNKGYVFEFGDAGPLPPVDPRYVQIVDDFDNVLALLEPPNKFTVTQIQNIIDTITNNTIAVVEKLQ